MQSRKVSRLISRLSLVWVAVAVAVAIVGHAPMAVPGDVVLADLPEPEPPVVTAPAEAEDSSPLESSSLTEPPLSEHAIHLKARDFHPPVLDAPVLQAWAARFAAQTAAQSERERVHVLLQLDFIPRQVARDALAARSIELLAYVPDYAWIASIPVADLATALQSPGITWAGPLLVEDKLAPAITADEWESYNLSASGVAAIYVVLHLDEGLETGRALVRGHGGKVTGEVHGLNALLVELPQANVRALAAEDAVQWIEPAAPPLGPANDGIREQIGVNAVQAAPYNLSGAGVDILIYDTGTVTATHPDFSGRLIYRDGSFVQDHSTHVAGVAAGDGSLSASAGGTALQWRGMAPQADVISYGYQPATSRMLFYDDPGDIEANWAAAQNVYGADVGNASLSSNIYSNGYPCARMGDYGLSSALMDQIVRGGNSAVGLGDKYIATWAVGNERSGACSVTGYSTTSPPAGAKNPIQVGASNTNDNSMTYFSSWGPTDDGRIKPLVVAGGGQSSGDGGIKSTIPNMFASVIGRNCDGNGDGYCYPYDVMQGTSMAAPAVAGSIALMLEHYRDVYHTSSRFWPSTARAILMQTAQDLGNPGPDYQWGYGLVDVQAAVDLISRRALAEASVAHDDVDTYYFIVPTDAAMVAVSLAWDDYEATLNADPALINDLDLELVSPSGVVWQPWVLDPASPANNAARGVDSVNNQEQVQVPTPEVGTWMVHVRGTTVPQSPQDYSLACEGCKPLDLGICHEHVSSTTGQSRMTSVMAPTSVLAQSPSAGEQWQRALEHLRALESGARQEERDLQEGLRALESALIKGPQAVVALLDTLTGRARDLAMDEIVRAQHQLADVAPSLSETPPANEAEEQAALARQATADAASRALALQRFDDPTEGQMAARVVVGEPPLPLGSAADLAVGEDCAYASISAAVAAANPGDRLLIEGGRTFIERVTITKSLTLQGGYNGCASGSSARTTIDGDAGGSVVRVEADLDVTLENLNVTNGSSGWGGGIWVGQNADLAATNVMVYGNVASQYGGGMRLLGGRATFDTNSAIYNNAAPVGGGVYASEQGSAVPLLSLSTGSGVYGNDALSGEGLGGGVYMQEGSVSLAGCSSIYLNDAFHGGGAYLVGATLTVEGACSRVETNTATGNGGGVYALGSAVQLDNGVMLFSNEAGAGGAGSGGGAFLDGSSLDSNSVLIGSNTARNFGGGVYAVESSTVDVDLGNYACLGAYCSTISYNTATDNYGGGIYASDSAVTLGNTRVENNAANIGGGIYAVESIMSVHDTLFTRNDATSGSGDGVRLYTSSVLTGTASTLAYNDAGGAGTGHAIDLSGAALTLNCSIVWGHASSIDAAGQNVAYSDVQGGYAGAGNLAVDPLFVSLSPFDYHLQTSSPLIDRCPSGTATDLDGETRPIVRTAAASPYDMGADEVAGAARVGVNGACAYGTIQQAVNAAADGDVVRVAAGVYFENVNVGGKDVAIAGGYNSACTAFSGGTTRVEGSAGSGSTIDVIGGIVTLRNLQIAWGSGSGGGLDARDGAQVTLENTDVSDNHADLGGGVYVDPISMVTFMDDSDIYDNTATSTGGGAWIAGQLLGDGTDSDVVSNCASDGGGLHVSGGTLYLDNADVVGNEASGTIGRGGGVYVTEGGVITLTNSSFVGDTGVGGNGAYDGGGIYADASAVYLDGSLTTVRNNAASNRGGGVYLTGGGFLYATGARVGYGAGNQADVGAGLYVANGTLDFSGSILGNVAASQGGGIYATSSVLNLTDTAVGGTGSGEPNQIDADGDHGAGLHLAGETQATLDAAIVAGNACLGSGNSQGGGAYVSGGSVLTLTNGSRVAYNQAPSSTGGRGGGLYIWNARVVLDNSQVVSNTASVAGGGVRLWGTGALDVRNGSSINYNECTFGEGGGIAAAGAPTITVSGATLHHNTAGINGGAVSLSGGTLDLSGWWDLRYNTASVSGGGIAVTDSGGATLAVTDGEQASFLSDNVASEDGGALYATNAITVELRADGGFPLQVGGNTASDDGGAIYTDGGASLQVTGDVQFASNVADGSGGALYLSEGALTADGPTFYDNWAVTHGGAVAAYTSTVAVGVDYTACSDLSEPCSVFSDNWADSDGDDSGNGGAIYASGGALQVDRTYLYLNRAASGGAIFQEGAGATGQVYNTLIYSNTVTAGFGAAIGAQGGGFTITHVTLANNIGGAAYAQSATTSTVQNSIAWGNIDGGITGTLVITACSIDQSGNAGSIQDPWFVSPGGGEDYRLLEDSPAIDACTAGLPKDVVNVPRPVGAGYDMGAYEYFVPSKVYLPLIMRH